MGKRLRRSFLKRYAGHETSRIVMEKDQLNDGYMLVVRCDIMNPL
jgi:hypothetical protein